MEPLLKMVNITKTFPGVKALDGVNFTLLPGSVHALMGENGAGKSTLMKCLFGIYEKDGGEILLEGKPVSFKNPKAALEQGVAMVHQELNQALSLSLADNLWLGRYPKKGGFIHKKAMVRETGTLFSSLGLTMNPNQTMGELSVSKRQMAEIVKALSYHAKVIVFDEPTSSLTEAEAEKLFEIIRKLKEKGCGIVYISHKMEEILQICDAVTVLRDGRSVSTHSTEGLTMDTVIREMVGRPLTGRFPPKTRPARDILLKVTDLGGISPLQKVSFTLGRGEILGLAGLEGAGRSQVLEALFGLFPHCQGEIAKNGKKILNSSPRAAIKNGFCLVTEERRATGILPNRDILENTVIARLPSYRVLGILHKPKMVKDTEGMIGRLRVKTPSRRTAIASLSGGNQQKVIFGRWLLTEPEILLLDEPTRGIDVGAKYEIYQLIQALSAKGKSVIVVSGELPELLGLCHRILVLSAGRVAGEVKADSATQEEIMALAAKYVSGNQVTV